MVHAAAEGIREKSKKDIPLEDPEKFRYTTWMEKEGENIVWHIDFISKTMDWGFCSATVNEATGKVRVLEADTGTITADNIFERFRAAYDYENDWTTETWGALGAAAPLLPAETTEGRIVKATPWIAGFPEDRHEDRRDQHHVPDRRGTEPGVETAADGMERGLPGYAD